MGGVGYGGFSFRGYIYRVAGQLWFIHVSLSRFVPALVLRIGVIV
ncbi:hypothetical protein E2C01_095549 [Portunus trituberculatus]|uniref:Uncharacterized protein n=1 Tax=Portunus trituberculatus TaxID=210409 RepID=A0A5B7K4H5_PORTR|nr:hypothetical protein [Portunus trituberculatus]